MRPFIMTVVVLTTLLSCQSKTKEEAPKPSSQVLFENLQSIAGKATLFGHQDDLAYGIGWKYEEGESDVKRLAGDYPALFGWELGGLELGHAVNLDKVPFDTMQKLAGWVHINGGINTFSWHPYSAIDTTKSSWKTDEVVVRHILPGGTHHAIFLNHMDQVVAFFKALKTEEGETIPFIFRPWHEMDGSWFWWGASLTTPEELKALFRFSIEYLHDKGVTNFLTAYSPDRHFNTQEEYLTWYPGDDLVDIIGMDNYYDLSQGEAGLKSAIQKLEIVAKYAEQTEKVAAFTETGLDGIGNTTWYTEALGALINASEWTRKTTYAMVWRNHDLSHFYVPHTGHPAAEDFKDFAGQENIWLLKDWAAYTSGKQ
jgi:mannan endo-1,4-beta-mannosidase